MIRYSVSRSSLEDRAGESWMSRAKDRATKITKAKAFREKTSIWSEVKPIFMDLQHNKCAFCERQLEGPEYGTIEHDLEHFRPKSAVASWPPTHHPKALKYTFSTGRTSKGYCWLAYDLANYAAACKTCNSPLKACFFPIAGRRGKFAASLAALAAEKPFLCHPLGPPTDDPETLVTFIATTAIPAVATGPASHRGRVIIDFFDLNGREHLHRDRARMLLLLSNALNAIAADDSNVKSIDLALVDRLISPDSPHAGCCRAFRKTWDEDRTRAIRIGEACKAYYAATDKPPPKVA